jgi:uncharacterized membrane protein YcfT
MTATLKPRVDWADTGRGIAIVLVTLFHATQWLASLGYPVAVWLEANEVLASLRIPLFFTLAGLFARKWLAVRWRDLWASKLSLYLWVFLVWEAIASVFFNLGLLTQGRCCEVRTAAEGWIAALVLPRFELWFIWVLAIFFVVAKLLRRVDFRIQLVLAGVLAAFALTGWEHVMNTGWAGAAKFFFFFLVGLYLRDRLLRLGSFGGAWFIAGSIALWAAVSLAFVLLDVEAVPGVYLVNCLLGLVGGIALSRVLARLPWLRRTGARTLPIYVAHTQVILVVVVALWLPPVHAATMPIAQILPVVLTVVAVAVANLLFRVTQGTILRFLYEQPPFATGRVTASLRRETGESTR